MLEGLTAKERELTAGMPDQVAIGFVKARRAELGPKTLAWLMDIFGPATDGG